MESRVHTRLFATYISIPCIAAGSSYPLPTFFSTFFRNYALKSAAEQHGNGCRFSTFYSRRIMNQFLVEFDLPDTYTENFISRIPAQRATVHRLMREGKIPNYALSMDRRKLWVFVAADSEREVETR